MRASLASGQCRNMQGDTLPYDYNCNADEKSNDAAPGG